MVHVLLKPGLENFEHYFTRKEMATHSSVLARIIAGAGKSGGLPSLGSHRVGYD